MKRDKELRRGKERRWEVERWSVEENRRDAWRGVGGENRKGEDTQKGVERRTRT